VDIRPGHVYVDIKASALQAD